MNKIEDKARCEAARLFFNFPDEVTPHIDKIGAHLGEIIEEFKKLSEIDYKWANGAIKSALCTMMQAIKPEIRVNVVLDVLSKSFAEERISVEDLQAFIDLKERIKREMENANRGSNRIKAKRGVKSKVG